MAFTSRPYGPGASFRDPVSGLRFVAHRPGDRPDLWALYLDGAVKEFDRYGLGWVIGRDVIGDGEAVSLFWLALDGDVPVAGARCHGPLRSAADAFALTELALHPDLDAVRRDIEARVPDGVVEMKGGWSDGDRPDHRALSNAVSRCCLHSMAWFGARYALLTTGEHVAARWRMTGARAGHDGISVPYPDDRYRTVRMWWDARDLAPTADPAQLAMAAEEARQLRVTGAPTPRQYQAVSPRRVGAAHTAAAASWRPVVLDPADEADAATVDDYLGAGALAVDDLYPAQLAELDALVPAPDADLLEEGPRWVVYPWRGRMVRLLGPRAFDRVRLDRNRNKITLAEQARLRQLRIGVVGLSVGHVVAHTLALEGLCGELRLADFDRIELSNLNRIPATLFDVGVNKAHVAARRIAELDPYLEVIASDAGVTAATIDAFVDGLDIVIEECDSLDIKLLVREAARRRGIPVIMETSDRGMLDVERFDLEPERPLFHGLVDDLRVETIAGLPVREKVPYVLRILEPEQLSARMAASMAEIDETLSTWPQLAGDVTLGGATVAATVRSLGLAEPLASGRVRIDLSTVLAGIAEPQSAPLLLDVPDVAPPAPPDDLVELVALAAGLAPSGGNTQPWRFEADDDEFRVYLDRTRTSSMDVAFRGSYVACGAALLNARVAAASRARGGATTILPDAADPDLVATLRFGDEIDVTLADLADSLWTRHSNRHEGDGAPLPVELLDVLGAEVATEGAHLTLVTDPAVVARCAELLAESDRVRYLSPWLHREMMSELRWPGRDTLDWGIDVRTLELDPADLAKVAVARRADIMEQLAAWDAGRALGEVTRDRVRASSGLAVVTAAGTAPADYVRAGMAVERFWLAADRAGVRVQPVSPVFIYAVDDADRSTLVPGHVVAHLRDLAAEFRETVGVGADRPLGLVLRVHHSPAPTTRSARLPLAEVLRRRTSA